MSADCAKRSTKAPTAHWCTRFAVSAIGWERMRRPPRHTHAPRASQRISIVRRPESVLFGGPAASVTLNSPVCGQGETKSHARVLRPILSPLRSTSVRLALGYAALFAASSLLLLGSLWWHTAGYIDRQIDGVIAADPRQIADQLHDFGFRGAVEAVNERIAEAPDGQAIYLLADPR